MEPDPPSRSRSIYLGPWRIDITTRSEVPSLVPQSALARAVGAALDSAGAPRPASIGLILTGDVELAGLNATHMGKDGPTDVLSFPLLPAEAFPAPGDGPLTRPSGVARTVVRAGALGARARTVAPAAAARAGAAAARAGAPAAVDFALPPGRRLHLGDIVVSVERGIEQAEAGRGGQTGDVRWSPADELRLLVTHGALHICGWDHADPADETAMRALEQRLLA